MGVICIIEVRGVCFADYIGVFLFLPLFDLKVILVRGKQDLWIR